MTPRDCKLNAIGHWLMEISALLAVFPALDQVIKGTLDWFFVGGAIILSLLLFAGGLILVRDK